MGRMEVDEHQEPDAGFCVWGCCFVFALLLLLGWSFHGMVKDLSRWACRGSWLEGATQARQGDMARRWHWEAWWVQQALPGVTLLAEAGWDLGPLAAS